VAESVNKIEIDLSALRHNFQAIKKVIGSAVKIMAVVKADAYGHGMIPVAGELSRLDTAAFGVAEVWEGTALRRAGIKEDIVVFLGCRPGETAEVVSSGLSPVVFEKQTIDELSRRSLAVGRRTGVHLKIDTGMGRLGITAAEAVPFLRHLKELEGIYLAGIMSHPPMADNEDPTLTREQNKIFAGIVESSQEIIPESAAHIANSAALIRFPELRWNMVRPGLALYGCYPADDFGKLIALKPVMSFKTRVIQVRETAEGCGVSYDHKFITSRPSRLAALPIGYHNGYLRGLSNRGQVLVQGCRAPVVGRVCMNITMIDVTDIPGVAVNDEVVVMGRQGSEEIRAEELAEWLGTINYEILCLLGNNNQRHYINKL
jgi:alanine racemase